MKDEYRKLVTESRQFLQENYEVTKTERAQSVPTVVKEKKMPPPPSTPKECAKDEMAEVLSKLLPGQKLLEKPVAVIVVYSSENEVKFFEALAKAINDELASCISLLCKSEKEFQEILKRPFLQLVLATGRGQLHQIEGKILSIASCGEYQTTIALKRALWNTLKSHFLPRSS